MLHWKEGFWGNMEIKLEHPLLVEGGGDLPPSQMNPLLTPALLKYVPHIFDRNLQF